MDQKRAPVTPAAKRRPNKQILEIKAAATEESGEIVEKQRKTGRLVAFPCQSNFDQGLLSEHRAFYIAFVCGAQTLKPLEVGKAVNHFQNRRNVGAGGGRDVQRAHRRSAPE